ncbi:MAG TPA: hypothetical protein IAC03_06460 [Candidatus Coprenecus pullistercoris]|nr:hypothetical protein [Candidatus Coprenecus pullistercoris]
MDRISRFTSVLTAAGIIPAILLLAAGCVHEYPEENAAVDPTEIALNIGLSTPAPLTQSPSGYVYFTAWLYKGDNTGTPVACYTASAARGSDGIASVSFDASLHAGKYTLAVFAASSPDSTGDGCVYDVSDLSGIVFKDNAYTGSDDLKECYDLRMEIDLPYDRWFGTDSVEGILEYPVGRVEIISEDAAEFATKQLAGRLDAVPEVLSDEFWQAYRIRWDYALYSPVGYNAVTGVPNLTDTGVGFLTDLTPISEDETHLGFDYIFVNGESTTVNISLSLYEQATGERINTYSGIKADIYKGRVTVIRGDYLTTEQGSGVGIDPGFEDDIEIVLPD